MSGTKLQLLCLVWPDNIPGPAVQHIFEVEIDDGSTVASLKKSIKLENFHALADVDARNLVLWKCSIPTDDNLDNSLKTIRFDQADNDRLCRLLPPYLISEVFKAPLLSKTIHILVELPNYEIVAPIVSLPNLREERLRFSAAFPEKPPSAQGAPSTFLKLQKTEDQKIVWSRPSSADATIPVTLMNNIFRRFIDDCENYIPNRQDNELVLELMGEMSAFYSHEGARAARLRNILTVYGLPFVTSTITSKGHNYTTDGSVEVNGNLLTIVEVKEEIGSKGAEPYAQSILYYTHSTMEKAPNFPNFNFPALLIAVFGQTRPQISFSGAVWTTRPHFQVLTPILPLFCHHTDTNMRISLARHFGACKTAVQSLDECYKGLTNTALLGDLDSQLPDPRKYDSLETKTIVNFRYLHQINEKKLLFVGETFNGERICIKFVRAYSPLAHEKCAEMGIAPKLRGFEDIGAGWKMVIMDALDRGYKPFDKRSIPLGAGEYLKDRLVELHQAKFVHGDVRDANIMVRKDGKLGLMLVDFDWSGIIGVVRYPININKVNIWRPDDVSDGELIRSEHDMAMLEHIFPTLEPLDREDQEI